MYGLIRDRKRTQTDAGDLLAMLLLARDEETGEAMTERQVRDETLTLLLAGHETTAAALAWAWYLLGLNPEIAERLRREVDAVLGERTPTFEDLGKLSLARAIFDETLRLYPGAWGQPRQAIADDEIGGYFIPAGSIVTVSQWVTHRRPDLWDDPDRFDPDRFAPGQASGATGSPIIRSAAAAGSASAPRSPRPRPRSPWPSSGAGSRSRSRVANTSSPTRHLPCDPSRPS